MNQSLLRQSIYDNAVQSFSRSGGPGGQNVNKVNTKVTLRLRLSDLTGLNETELARTRQLLVNRISTEDELVIHADEERSQKTNLERAYFRLESIIVTAARLPKQRRPTKPSKAACEQRLNIKRMHGQKKAIRLKHLDPDE